MENNKEINLAICITRNCNLSCEFCYMEMTGQMINLDILKKNLSYNKFKNVYLTGGEPFIHPQCKEIIRWIRSRCSHLFILTNGTLLDRNWIRYLKAFDVNIILSLRDSMNNMRKKLHEANQIGLNININHILTQNTMGILENFSPISGYVKNITFLYPTSTNHNNLNLYGLNEWRQLLMEALSILKPLQVRTYYEPAFMLNLDNNKLIRRIGYESLYMDVDCTYFTCCLLADIIKGSSDLNLSKCDLEFCPVLNKAMKIPNGYKRICPLIVEYLEEYSIFDLS